MTHDAIKGIVAAPLLPMLRDQSIDWDGLASYTGWVAEQKPAAIAMNMDASEGTTLTHAEQLEVMRVAKRAIAGKVPLFSGLIARFTADAVAWAQELKGAGAEGLALFPPLPVFLGRPAPVQMLYDYHKAIADAADIPIIAFQQPIERAPDYTPEVIRAFTEIPQFVALKEASFDTGHTLQSIEAARHGREIGILTGSDTILLEAFLIGCHGGLIGFAGTAVEELVSMQRAAAARDVPAAYAIWDRLGPLARYCWRAPLRNYRPRMKEVLVMQGLFRTATVRRPQMDVNEAERTELHRLATHAGLLEGEALRAAGD
jgi:4-hydroxy-tetrahydrodipicolinate synthase